MKVEYRFNIGDEIEIIPFEAKGIIQLCGYDGYVNSYYVKAKDGLSGWYDECQLGIYTDGRIYES